MHEKETLSSFFICFLKICVVQVRRPPGGGGDISGFLFSLFPWQIADDAFFSYAAWVCSLPAPGSTSQRCRHPWFGVDGRRTEKTFSQIFLEQKKEFFCEKIKLTFIDAAKSLRTKAQRLENNSETLLYFSVKESVHEIIIAIMPMQGRKPPTKSPGLVLVTINISYEKLPAFRSNWKVKRRLSACGFYFREW